MRKKILTWLGKEFVSLSGEAVPGGSATEEARDLFRRFADELREEGLSLDHTLRTRLWGRDRQSRDEANDERYKTLTGKARSVSSSYYSPGHFASNARVALDLLALRPSRADLEKALREYEPPLVPLRYLIWDSVVLLSGVTAVLPTLEDQLANILPRIGESLRDAGASWEKVAKASFYLHRSQERNRLKEIFAGTVNVSIPRMEYVLVDGYSSPGKLIEVEVTARL